MDCLNACCINEEICKYCKENYIVSSTFYKAKRALINDFVTGYLVKDKNGKILGILSVSTNFKELAFIDKETLVEVIYQM